MMMLLAMDMARTAAEDYYAYWESGNEQKIEQMAKKTLWLGLVLAAAGAWAYYMDEMNQMGFGENVTIYIEDGVFKTGYGDYVYTYDELLRLLGGE